MDSGEEKTSQEATMMRGANETDSLLHPVNSSSSVASLSPTHKLTVATALVFIVGETAGSGILALPKAMEQTGWIGLVVLAFCCIAAGWCGVLLGKCWTILEERFPEYQDHCRDPYPSIGYEAFGKVGKIVVSVTIYVCLFGVCVVFLILAAENLSQLFEKVPHMNLSPCFWMLIVALIEIPAVWLGTPKDFWPAAVGATVATGVACGFLIAAIASDVKVTHHEPVVHDDIQIETFLIAFGTMIFSFGGAPAFPTIQHDMNVPTDFPKAVFWGFLVLMLMYMPVATVGYFLFGSRLEDNILQSLDHSWMLYTVESLITIHLLFAFVIVLNPFCQELEKLSKVPLYFSWKRAVLRTLCVLAVLFVAESIPHFGAILSLLGGSTNTLLTFIFPCVFYLKLCSMENYGWPERRASMIEKVFSVEVSIIAAVGGVAATYSAIKVIASPSTFVPPCYLNYTDVM